MFKRIKYEYLKMMKDYHAEMMDKSYDVHNEYINNEFIRSIAARSHARHLKKWADAENKIYDLVGIEYLYERGV